MASSAHLLSLLADDIKLSLLERQRSVSLGLEPDAQNGHLARNLEALRTGLDGLAAAPGDDSADDLARLRARYDDLTAQFHGFAATTSATSPATDISPAAAVVPPSPAAAAAAPVSHKAVRFRDAEVDADEEATRAALFPYRDDPEAQRPDHSQRSNPQLQQYHDQVMAEQDEQLDQLGESISRQRELGQRLGDELDEHVQMLDDVDRHVDRQQGRLDGARARIGRIARRANDNRQLTTIVVLIVILVLLIIILK